MPQKNKGKGGKRHRRGKKGNVEAESSKMTKKAEGNFEKYGKITKLAGDCRVAVVTPSDEAFICHIPGKFRKRVWMKVDDIILFTIRPFEQGKGDVISVYNSSEVRWLTMKKELPSTFSNIELNADGGGQDIMWNRPVGEEDDSFEDNSDIAEEAKEARRAEKIARDAVPEQNNVYDMPSSDSEDDYINVNPENMLSILDEL